jgi:hypothetical protein
MQKYLPLEHNYSFTLLTTLSALVIYSDSNNYRYHQKVVDQYYFDIYQISNQIDRPQTEAILLV